MILLFSNFSAGSDWLLQMNGHEIAITEGVWTGIDSFSIIYQYNDNISELRLNLSSEGYISRIFITKNTYFCSSL